MPTVFKVRSNISNTTMVGNEVMVCPTAQRNLVLTIRLALSNKGFECQNSAKGMVRVKAGSSHRK